MRLGILVTTDRHLKDLEGITHAALSREIEVDIFLMDEGVRLLPTPELRNLSSHENVSVAYCDYSTLQLDISREGFPEQAETGSQYDNALMVKNVDKVVSL